MNADLLPVLHLRRQAATYGWRLAAVTGPRHARTYRYERVDEDGVHKVYVRPGWVPPPGGDWSEHRSLRVVSHASDGFLKIEHVGELQAVGILRAYFGWPPADSVAWPPRSRALVPVGVYAATGGRAT